MLSVKHPVPFTASLGFSQGLGFRLELSDSGDLVPVPKNPKPRNFLTRSLDPVRISYSDPWEPLNPKP